MKKILSLGLVILVCFSGYLYWSKSSAPVSETVIQRKSQSSSRKLFLGARQTKSKTIKTSSLSENDGCEELTSNLEKLDFNVPVSEWVESLDQKAFNQCQLKDFKDRLADIQKDCIDKLKETECTTHAIFLRSLLRTRGVDDGEDLELLADLVLREFADNRPDFDKLKKLSEKMLELDPTQLGYQKLWASSQIVSKLHDGKSPMDGADLVNQRVSPDLWNDPSMDGVKLAMATNLEPINVESYARGYLAQKSDASMHEILGWSLWKQDRQAEAMVELNRAIALRPNDQWLKDQLKNIQGRNANRDSYGARITLGINVQDLYQ